MVHCLVLCKLKPEVDEEKIEWMMRQTRIRLLKIPEAHSVQCGKRIAPEMEWPFFLSIDATSLETLAICKEDANHMKFLEEVIRPNVSELMVLDYEMDPLRDVRYS